MKLYEDCRPDEDKYKTSETQITVKISSEQFISDHVYLQLLIYKNDTNFNYLEQE